MNDPIAVYKFQFAYMLIPLKGRQMGDDIGIINEAVRTDVKVFYKINIPHTG
jgi:hypothetical protein